MSSIQRFTAESLEEFAKDFSKQHSLRYFERCKGDTVAAFHQGTDGYFDQFSGWLQQTNYQSANSLDLPNCSNCHNKNGYYLLVIWKFTDEVFCSVACWKTWNSLPVLERITNDLLNAKKRYGQGAEITARNIPDHAKGEVGFTCESCQKLSAAGASGKEIFAKHYSFGVGVDGDRFTLCNQHFEELLLSSPALCLELI